MTEADKQFMEANRWAVESYSQESPPRHLSMMNRERLLRIVNENFGVKMTPDLWCGACLKDFIINAYQLYDASK